MQSTADLYIKVNNFKTTEIYKYISVVFFIYIFIKMQENNKIIQKMIF